MSAGNLILHGDSRKGTAHQGRTSAGDNTDKKIIHRGLLNDFKHSLTYSETVSIGQRVAGGNQFNPVELVAGFQIFDGHNSSGNSVSQDFIDSTGHGIGRLSATNNIDIFLSGQIPVVFSKRKPIPLPFQMFFYNLVAV